jgi:hypothetical protein
MSASKHPQAASAPEGTIDPLVRMVTFWQGERPLAALSYYATHPMSYYGKGGVNWDFIGGARALMDKAVPGVRFIHFNGAGGNITAGKYNDGSPENRPVLAERVYAGMKAAWDAQKKQPVTAADLEWRVKPVALPVRHPDAEQRLLATLADAKKPFAQRAFAARDIVFIRRMAAGGTIPLRMPPHRLRASCFTCQRSCSSNTRSPHSRCARMTSSPWPPTATTPRATSAPRSPTRRAATRSVTASPA